MDDLGIAPQPPVGFGIAGHEGYRSDAGAKTRDHPLLQAFNVGVARQVIDQDMLGIAPELGLTGRVIPAGAEYVAVAAFQHVVRT